MAQQPLSTGMPQAPFVDPGTGDITVVWRMFLTQMWLRTGSALGIDSATSTRLIEAERQQRITADLSLTAGLAAETARAESAESTLGHEIDAETQARVNSDLLARIYTDDAIADAVALLVPLAQLCTLWSQCNLLFLPTADPGGGRVWVDADGHLTIGLIPPAPELAREDGTGEWTLESGGTAADWAWG